MLKFTPIRTTIASRSLDLPTPEKLEKMRKVTDKLQFKDNKHPLNPMQHYCTPKTREEKGLLVAVGAPGCPPPKGPKDNNINKNNINEIYKNFIKLFNNNNHYPTNLKNKL